MNMKCVICGSDKFHLDVDQQILSCTDCSFYCDFKVLVRGGAASQPHAQRPAYNPDDFEIVGGVLKKYKGAAVNVVVPDGVIEIGTKAFFSLKYLESVKLPKGVKTIGPHAFEYCQRLKSVELPDTLEVIDGSAFSGCTSLMNIHLPKRLQLISGKAFYNCDSLVNIHLPEGLKTIGGSAFQCCKSLKSINIPNSVEVIAATWETWGSSDYERNRCFDGCDNLEFITYPTDRFSVHTFDGSLFYRLTPEGKSECIRKRQCPVCKSTLNLFRKCNHCNRSW